MTHHIRLLGRYSLMYCTYLRDEVIAEDFFVRFYRKTVLAGDSSVALSQVGSGTWRVYAGECCGQNRSPKR